MLPVSPYSVFDPETSWRHSEFWTAGRVAVWHDCGPFQAFAGTGLSVLDLCTSWLRKVSPLRPPRCSVQCIQSYLFSEPFVRREARRHGSRLILKKESNRVHVCRLSVMIKQFHKLPRLSVIVVRGVAVLGSIHISRRNSIDLRSHLEWFKILKRIRALPGSALLVILGEIWFLVFLFFDSWKIIHLKYLRIWVLFKPVHHALRPFCFFI